MRKRALTLLKYCEIKDLLTLRLCWRENTRSLRRWGSESAVTRLCRRLQTRFSSRIEEASLSI